MPNVTLLRPVIHDGENLVPGDVIRDMPEKAAQRLVRLGVAVMGAMVKEREPASSQTETVKALPPEKEALIKKMKKAELLAALVAAGVEAGENELVVDLKQKLSEAWSEDVAAPASSAEEEEEINNMNKAELLDMLISANVTASDQETEEELRAKLKAAWSADMKG